LLLTVSRKIPFRLLARVRHVAGVQQLLHASITKVGLHEKYTILFAEDVPHYGTAEIRAENDAAALEAAKACPLFEVTNDAEWENSACKRIVYIQDAEGNTIAEDVSLDDCSLRYGGDKERAMCDAAPNFWWPPNWSSRVGHRVTWLKPFECSMQP
jgi:hypothetical protein